MKTHSRDVVKTKKKGEKEGNEESTRNPCTLQVSVRAASQPCVRTPWLQGPEPEAAQPAMLTKHAPVTASRRWHAACSPDSAASSGTRA